MMVMPAAYQMGKTSKYEKYVRRRFQVREREALSLAIGLQRLQQGKTRKMMLPGDMHIQGKYPTKKE